MSELGSGGQTLQVRTRQSNESGRLRGHPVKQPPPSGPHEGCWYVPCLPKTKREPLTPSLPAAVWMECQTYYLVTFSSQPPSPALTVEVLSICYSPTLMPPSPGNPSSFPLFIFLCWTFILWYLSCLWLSHVNIRSLTQLSEGCWVSDRTLASGGNSDGWRKHRKGVCRVFLFSWSHPKCSNTCLFGSLGQFCPLALSSFQWSSYKGLG